MEAPGYWDNPEKAQQGMITLKGLKDEVETYEGLKTSYEDIETLLEMGYEENESSVIPEIEAQLEELENEYEEFKDEPSHLYRMEEMYLSKDTVENRFLKYALNNIADRFKHVRKNVMKVLKADNVDMFKQIKQMDEELTAISNAPFFRDHVT